MKLKTILFAAMAAMTFAAFPVTAHGTHLHDSADLVAQSDFQNVDDALAEAETDHHVYVAVKTTDSLEGMSIANYADQWYETEADIENGVVLVVSADSREYFILTSGSCIYSFTDAGLDYIEAQIVPDMSKGDYAGAFMEFARLCDDFLIQAADSTPYDAANMPKEPFNVGKSLLIALVVGLVAGGIGVLVLFSNLKSVHQQQGAADYTKQGSFQLEHSHDMYLYKKVKRREKPDENKQSANRGSTTFTGGSGSSRGGSGGTF